jgi:hypothetical protein
MQTIENYSLLKFQHNVARIPLLSGEGSSGVRRLVGEELLPI